MYNSITIRNFRCFEHLNIDHFTPLNLITGYNNVGKSAILEALWLHSAPNNPGLSIRLLGFRGIEGLQPTSLLNDLHYDLNPDNTVEIIAQGSWGNKPKSLSIYHENVPETWIPFSSPNGSTRSGGQETDSKVLVNSKIVWEYIDEQGDIHKSLIRWNDSVRSENEDNTNLGIAITTANLPPTPINVLFSAHYRESSNVDCNLFSDLIKRGEEHLVVDCLKQIDSRLKKVVILTTPTLALYADTGLNQFIPVGLLGDGANRLLSMSLAFFRARGGILLIDEVESGIHHLKLPLVWRHLSTLAKHFNVQVFATTHSAECIRAAHTALATDSSRALSIHRIDQHEAGQLSTTYHDETLDYAVEFDSEMR